MSTQAFVPEREDVLKTVARALEQIAVVLHNEADRRAQEREAEAGGDGDALTPDECAKELGIGAWAVYRAIKRKDLIAEKYGPRLYRVRRAALETFRRRHRIRS